MQHAHTIAAAAATQRSCFTESPQAANAAVHLFKVLLKPATCSAIVLISAAAFQQIPHRILFEEFLTERLIGPFHCRTGYGNCETPPLQ